MKEPEQQWRCKPDVVGAEAHGRRKTLHMQMLNRELLLIRARRGEAHAGQRMAVRKVNMSSNQGKRNKATSLHVRGTVRWFPHLSHEPPKRTLGVRWGAVTKGELGNELIP